MHRPQPSRRRSSYSPQLFAAVAFLVLLFLSLSILQIRLSSSPHLLSSSANQPNSSSSSLTADDRTDDLLLLDETQKPEDTAPTLFWDHALAVARISFDPPLSASPLTNHLPPPDLTFGSDDEPVDESVRSKLASIRRIEDVLLLEKNSPLRDGWARWLETKGDFIKRDRMLRSTNGEMLNPRNHFLLQDPDVAGFAGMSRGDRMMQKALLKEMEEGGGGFLGVGSKLGFSEFVDRFLDGGDCLIRVFMVWNSPSWSFGVRQRRGVESLLHHHRDACVLLFSETVEQDFFKEFVKDGFRIAVVKPNLDELLKDTPAHVFASVWFEWRKTKYYPLHYSELVRLAALYKYGGVYLDSDLIVLKPLYLLKNSVCVENQSEGNSTYNGAVMAFERQSPFVKECLTEFYSTYDNTLLMWNGADLLTRVLKRLQGKGDKSWEQLGVNIISPQSIFPISSKDITRYFAVAEESERVHHEKLFRRILNESYTFHFWNGITSTLVPEPGSLAEKLLNRYCLRCLDIL